MDNSKPSQSQFTIKLRIEEGERAEHMWMTSVRYDGIEFFGKLNNEPLYLTSVKRGDDCHVLKHQISDWMYVEDGKLQGGFSIRLLRERMAEDERQEFDRSVEFTIE